MNNIITNSVFDKYCGLLVELNTKFSEQDIARLERLGYISISLSPKGATWSLTDRGAFMHKSLSENNNIFTKIVDFFYRRILKYKVNL